MELRVDHMRETSLIAIIAVLPLGIGDALAQQPRPNPNALINQWLDTNEQRNIDAALRSAKEHASAGRRDAAIAGYRKALALSPRHPAAVAGLKALGLDDAAIAAPLQPAPKPGSIDFGGSKSSTSPARGGGGGGGMFPNGLN